MTTTITSTSGRSTSSAAVTCTTAVPGKYGHVPVGSCNSYYSFNPSFSANLAFAAVFGLSTVAHIVQAIIFRKRFCRVVIMGGAWEYAAFVLRVLGARDQQNQYYVISGTLLLYLAPLWITAFVYMTVARLVHFCLPQRKMWHVQATYLTTIFVWLDVICFIIQVAGGILLFQKNSRIMSIGMKVYTAGIAIQLGFIVIFGVMALHLYYLVLKAGQLATDWAKYLIWVMLAALVLISVRIIFRLVEFSPGTDASNPMISHEMYALMLDAFPMALALVLLNVIHPGIVLQGPDSDFPQVSKAEKKAIRQQKRLQKQQRKALARASGDVELLAGQYARLDTENTAAAQGR